MAFGVASGSPLLVELPPEANDCSNGLGSWSSRLRRGSEK
jgi:hypothetical protein